MLSYSSDTSSVVYLKQTKHSDKSDKIVSGFNF